MTVDGKDAARVLRAIWDLDAVRGLDDDETVGHKKACKRMRDVTFDGMAPPGTDLREAWRERLRSEGKLSTSGGSIRDLVLGEDPPR